MELYMSNGGICRQIGGRGELVISIEIEDRGESGFYCFYTILDRTFSGHSVRKAWPNSWSPEFCEGEVFTEFSMKMMEYAKTKMYNH